MPIPEAISQKKDDWIKLKETYSEDRTNVSENPKFEQALWLLSQLFEQYADYLKPFYDQEFQIPGEEREDFQSVSDILDHLFLWVNGVVDTTRSWSEQNQEWGILSEAIKKCYVDPTNISNLGYAWSTARNILKIFTKEKDEATNYSLEHFRLITYLKELARDLIKTGFIIKDTLAKYYYKTASFYAVAKDSTKAIHYLHYSIKLNSKYLAQASSDRDLGFVYSSQEFQNILKQYHASDGSIIAGRDFFGNYNKINSAEIDSELKGTLLQLGKAVDTMLQKLPAEQAAEVAEDFGKLVDEAVKPKPNQKWYSVSIEGLIKAAENLDKLGTPVISLSRKVLSLLTGGVTK